MLKEKMIELAKEHAKDLGIRIVRLTGESLIKFAENLMTANMTKTIKFDGELDAEDLKSVKEAINFEPGSPRFTKISPDAFAGKGFAIIAETSKLIKEDGNAMTDSLKSVSERVNSL